MLFTAKGLRWIYMKRGSSRIMTLEQRAEISASKRFDKVKDAEKWKIWRDLYLEFLSKQALPAAKLDQYVRVRPHDMESFSRQLESRFAG